MDRTAVFLDAGYIEKVLEKEFARPRIDFGTLVRELTHGRDLLRAYYYNCPPHQSSPPTMEELQRKRNADRFFEALQRIPRFEVRLGKLEKRHCRHCGYVELRQKRADLMLGVDLVNLSVRGQINCAVVVTGDSDLLPAIQVAKECGVIVHLFHGGKANPPHYELFTACDERTKIDWDLIQRAIRGSKTRGD